MRLKWTFFPSGGTKREVEHPIWLNTKKHYCPECRGELRKVEVSKIVNSKSEEARYYDFSAPGGGRFFGDVQFSWTELQCSRCGKQYTIKEIRKREGY